MIRTFVQALLTLTTAAGIAQQTPSPKPAPMPQDRVADSYAIYSQLLPSNAIEWGDAKRNFWLVEETTATRVQDPREAIQAPQGREGDLQALFYDYDEHKSDVILLASDSFRTKLPVHLADAATQKRFQNPWVPGPAPRTLIQSTEFRDAAGMHSFSQVYFNPSHTLAMVYFGMYCGSLCGERTWVVLERKAGQWIEVPWVHSSTIS